ncbi:MAG: hypothetical protein WD005_02140 [Haliea sp.]
MLTKSVKLLAKPLYRKYREITLRIASLEAVVDCLLEHPNYVAADHVGFNGQRFRKQIFQELLDLFDFDFVVETGTCTGDTTGYMRQESGLPVVTCELNRRFHAIAKMRLKDLNQITFHLGDSRSFLREFCTETGRICSAMVYLDAHWHDDLPLDEEIEILCEDFERNFVVMIDDFEVPGDAGYGYDDYGKHKSLTMETFEPTFARNGLTPFFPTAPSEHETGARRGCVILARGSNAAKLQSAQTVQMR